MDFSFSALMAGFVFGIFGMFFIRQSRARGNPAFAVIGLVLIVFPYFVTNPWITWGIGGVLMAAGYRLRNL